MYIDVVKLRATMLESDMKQKDLAEKASLSYSMMNAICRGRACSTETAGRIAAALHIPLEDLRKNGGE